ncbi:MAG: MFS transporter, partial [Prolixibacteraceae bacterium]|nr:MFS transporter [Prolixibacteraceae bacterium]
ARRLVDRFGVGKITFISLLIYCLSLLGPLLAYNYISLCIFLFIFGLTSSLFAIALNSLTATIEKQDQVYIMSGSHGFWSIGGAIGAASGSFLAAWLENTIVHASIVIVFIVGIQLVLKKNYYHRKSDQIENKPKQYTHLKPLLIIAFVGLIFMVAEGAIADWSALYLKKIVQIPLPLIGMGYASFSVGMVIGRFTGDSLSKKLGSWHLLSMASIVSLVGFIFVLIVKSGIPIFGFFVVGLGFSVIVPEIYRLASQVKGVKTSDGVSFIAATTNIGFLVGPVFLGFLAELKSLHFSFVILTLVVASAMFVSFWKYRQNLTKQ